MTENDGFRRPIRETERPGAAKLEVAASYQAFVDKVVKRHPDLAGLKTRTGRTDKATR